MNLTKAIEIIQQDVDDETVEWDSPLGEAYKLSFEALKRHRDKASRTFAGMLEPLPGETKD